MKSYLTYLALLASSVTADVHFETGSWSGEVRWEIVDASGKALCTGGPYPRNYEKYENVCELGGGKYTVNCHDTSNKSMVMREAERGNAHQRRLFQTGWEQY